MAQREVTIKISATDNFSAVTRKYREAMGDAEQATNRAGQSAQRNRGFFGAMGQEIQGALAGVTVAAAFQAIGALNEVGMTARQQGAIFRQMTGEMGVSVEEMMSRLRQATRGTLEDTSLMEGANFLKRMNLVESADEMENLVSMIMTLKKPTDDATSAMENFGLMISNQSLLRLDSFGLSSARVKERMEELQATLGREEAFRIATFEEMRVQVERLGPAADAASSSFQRMGTHVQNVIGLLGGVAATGLEAAAQLAEGTILIIQKNIDDAEKELQDALSRHEQGMGLVEDALAANPDAMTLLAESEAGIAGTRAGEVFVDKFTNEVLSMYEAYPSLIDPTDLLRMTSYSGLLNDPETADVAVGEVMRLLNAYHDVTGEIERQAELAEQLAQQEERRLQFADANALIRRAEYERDVANAFRQLENDDQMMRSRAMALMDDGGAAYRSSLYDQSLAMAPFANLGQINEQAIRRAGVQTREAMQRERDALLAELAQLETAGPQGYGAGFMSGPEALRVEGVAERIGEIVGLLGDLENEGIVSEGVVDRAGALRDQMEASAESARALADNTARTFSSLDGIFGLIGERTPMQQLTGDITSEVAASLGAAGVPQETIDAYTRAAGFASGERNEASDLFEREVLPQLTQIAQDFGPEESVEAAQRAAERFTALVEQGLSPADMAAAIQSELFSGALTGYRGSGGGGRSIDVQPGWGWSSVANAAGMSLAELDQMMGFSGGSRRPLHPGELTIGSGGGLTPAPTTADWFGQQRPTMGEWFSDQQSGLPGGEAPDLSGTESSMKGIADSTAKTATSSAVWNETLGAVDGLLPNVVGGAGKLSSHVGEAADKTKLMKDYIDELSKKIHVIKLAVDVDTSNVPAWMDDWLAGGMARVVESRGGTVPGTDSRVTPAGRTIPK